MMRYTEFNTLRIKEIGKLEIQNFSFIMENIEKYNDIFDIKYNKIDKFSQDKFSKKEKTEIDEIIDNVFISVKKLNPNITYNDVKQQVIDYIQKNNKLIKIA